MTAQLSITQIASLIGHHKSTISIELRRNAYMVCGRVNTPKRAPSPLHSFKRLLEVPISNVSFEASDSGLLILDNAFRSALIT